MQRVNLTPRTNWQQIVERHGLTFHSPSIMEPQPYWDESAAYQFSAAESRHSSKQPPMNSRKCASPPPSTVIDKQVLSQSSRSRQKPFPLIECHLECQEPPGPLRTLRHQPGQERAIRSTAQAPRVQRRHPHVAAWKPPSSSGPGSSRLGKRDLPGAGILSQGRPVQLSSTTASSLNGRTWPAYLDAARLLRRARVRFG